jgi:hypothetical protein
MAAKWCGIGQTCIHGKMDGSDSFMCMFRRAARRGRRWADEFLHSWRLRPQARDIREVPRRPLSRVYESLMHLRVSRAAEKISQFP